MYEEALMILKKLEEHGYKAYIVGGYPRDKYLGMYTEDIDICTNAKPSELKVIFDIEKQIEKFGTSIIKKGLFTFEVTTFRRELEYKNHRYPSKIEFVNTLAEDLQRRDFIMNTLCIDSSGNYVDLLGARCDLDNRIIRTVGDSDKKIEEDALRIVRAIKFKIKLGFTLDNNLMRSIQKYKDYLKIINKDRIDKELVGIDSLQFSKIISELNEI